MAAFDSRARWRARAAIVLLLVGCRHHQSPPPTPGGPMLVELRGTIQALDALPAQKGILIAAQGHQQLADGTWSVRAYLSAPELIDELRARGLSVQVLQTPEQMARESEELARQLEARAHPPSPSDADAPRSP